MPKFSKKKVQKILDIDDNQQEKLKDEKPLSFSDVAKTIPSESIDKKEQEEKEKYLERKKEAEKFSLLLNEIKNKKGDEEFIKESLKELSSIGMVSLRQMQEELLLDPSGRMGECMAALLNSVVNALKELNEIENEKKKIDIEKEKLDIKKQNLAKISNPNTTNNVVVIGSLADALNVLKNEAKKQEQEEIKNIQQQNSINVNELENQSTKVQNYKDS
ncbi:MAG: hypothetical protein NZZ41_01125 [Candidatus Dojkabacteria bacterium]|nr:hypothetical protein [Candidatus Dojkabacteria bacterium]